MNRGIDCATPLTTKSSQAIAAAGYSFAARYLVPASYAWKRLTRSEAEAITDAGMQIVSVYEADSNGPIAGGPAGEKDGIEAFREAQLVGQPLGSAIYFAVDFDAQPRHYDAIEAYLRAAAKEVPGYLVCVYGSYAVIEEMAKRKACTAFWQTYAWSRGKKSAKANIYQHQNDVRLAGIGVDLNESYGGEGWWNTNEEVKPTMSEEDANKIIRFISAGWYAAITSEAKAEFQRLANEVRKAAGIPLQ